MFFGPEQPINIYVLYICVFFGQFTKAPGRLNRLQLSEPNPGGGVRGGVLYYSIVVQLCCGQHGASGRFGPLASADSPRVFAEGGFQHLNLKVLCCSSGFSLFFRVYLCVPDT